MDGLTMSLLQDIITCDRIEIMSSKDVYSIHSKFLLKIFGEKLSDKILKDWIDVHQKFYNINATVILREVNTKDLENNDVFQTVMVGDKFKNPKIPIGPLLMLKNFLPQSQYQKYKSCHCLASIWFVKFSPYQMVP